jgi:hypothetical protein
MALLSIKQLIFLTELLCFITITAWNSVRAEATTSQTPGGGYGISSDRSSTECTKCTYAEYCSMSNGIAFLTNILHAHMHCVSLTPTCSSFRVYSYTFLHALFLLTYYCVKHRMGQCRNLNNVWHYTYFTDSTAAKCAHFVLALVSFIDSVSWIGTDWNTCHFNDTASGLILTFTTIFLIVLLVNHCLAPLSTLSSNNTSAGTSNATSTQTKTVSGIKRADSDNEGTEMQNTFAAIRKTPLDPLKDSENTHQVEKQV